MRLDITGLRLDRELQIVQGDVHLELNNTTVIEEPLCIDVGMPALAASLTGNIWPNRWTPPEDWRSKPIFVCGCGDPECRAFSIGIEHHIDTGMTVLTEIEEREDGSFRVLDTFEVPTGVYQQTTAAAIRRFLDFAEELGGYQPLYKDTLLQVRHGLSEYMKWVE